MPLAGIDRRLNRARVIGLEDARLAGPLREQTTNMVPSAPGYPNMLGG